MKRLIKLLHEGDYSCVIQNKDEIRTFVQRGVADLYYLLKNEPNFTKNADIADKVVGKGAAALMILCGIKSLYAEIISSSALSLLKDAGVNVEFNQQVPYIENRDKTGKCPVETLCENAKTAEEALPLIEKFLESMRK